MLISQFSIRTLELAVLKSDELAVILILAYVKLCADFTVTAAARRSISVCVGQWRRQEFGICDGFLGSQGK